MTRYIKNINLSTQKTSIKRSFSKILSKRFDLIPAVELALKIQMVKTGKYYLEEGGGGVYGRIKKTWYNEM